MKFAACAVLSCLCFAGCARVEVYKTTDLVNGRPKSGAVRGVRFYQPAPYLKVTTVVEAKDGASKTTLNYEIVYLPNYEEEYVFDAKEGWGTVKSSIALQNGWMLTNIGAESDSKGPETITAFAGLLKEAAAIGTLVNTNKAEGIPPGLYRIKWNPCSEKMELDRVELTVAGKQAATQGGGNRQ